jgi:hypothetical protein
MATKQVEANKRYIKKLRESGNYKVKQVCLALHTEIDKDVIERLSEVPSKNGYIKRLIREDMEVNPNEVNPNKEIKNAAETKDPKNSAEITQEDDLLIIHA